VWIDLLKSCHDEYLILYEKQIFKIFKEFFYRAALLILFTLLLLLSVDEDKLNTCICLYMNMNNVQFEW
jgi:hypothetical protein